MARLIVLLLLLPILGASFMLTRLNLTYSLSCISPEFDFAQPFSFTFEMVEKDLMFNDQIGIWDFFSATPLATGSVLGSDNSDGPFDRTFEFGLDWKHNCTKGGEWKKEEHIHLADCPAGGTCVYYLKKNLLSDE